MAKTIAYRELVKKLKEHDARFRELDNRGKGSHRMIFHPDINGKKASYPLPYHGSKTDLHHAYVKAIIKRFHLPKELFD